ncbi:MAG: Fur family transcriptional regulator [Brooklawnia sp.]|uniref:Fur family transcriptional regulator n=1 Tax=Brooklawnia sp. TaxID=2699740 RepID=UPI003C71F158
MNTDQTIVTGPSAPRPRLTRQRQLIVDRLDGADEFLTAQQVHGALRSEGESIGLATVYRGLQWLVDAGLVDTIRTQDGEAAYRRCSPAHHHHLICRRCGRAVEVAGEALEAWSQQVAAQHGFREPEHFAEVYGICSTC